MPRDYLNQPYVPAKDPLTAVPPSRHPFQVWILFACVLAGAGNLVDSQSVINELLPPIIVTIWAICLMASGLLGLIGAFLKDRILGLLLERAGLSTLALASIAYGTGIVFIVGAQAAVSGPLTMSVGIASAWRVIHVNRELKILEKFIGSNYRT